MSESMPEATPETTPETATARAVAPGPRASRQELVVPPRHSNLSAVIGACLCAVAGFGLVWGLGIGRGPSASGDSQPEPPTVAQAGDGPESRRPTDDASTATQHEPDMLPPVDEAIPTQPTAQGGRWNSRPAGHEAPPADADDRYAVRPTSLDMPDAVLPASGDIAPPRPLPRFAAARLEPVPGAVMPVAADVPADPQPASAPSDERALPATDAPANLVPPTPQVEPQAADLSPAQPFAMPVNAEATSPTPHATTPERLPEDTGDLAAAEPLPPAAATVATPATPAPMPPPPAAAFGAAPPPFSGPVPQAPLPPPAAFVPPPAMPSAAAMPPAPPAVTTTVASSGSPFAAAPAVVPGGLAAADPEQHPAAAAPPRQAPATGQGRPGPMQLEGVQTPQVSVEKRGPREISVGKPARYEIIVRNVGSATAHDVLLRDAIPQEIGRAHV